MVNIISPEKNFILWNRNTKHCSARILFNFVKLNNCQINWHLRKHHTKNKRNQFRLKKKKRKKNEKKNPADPYIVGDGYTKHFQVSRTGVSSKNSKRVAEQTWQR